MGREFLGTQASFHFIFHWGPVYLDVIRRCAHKLARKTTVLNTLIFANPKFYDLFLEVECISLARSHLNTNLGF